MSPPARSYDSILSSLLKAQVAAKEKKVAEKTPLETKTVALPTSSLAETIVETSNVVDNDESPGVPNPKNMGMKTGLDLKKRKLPEEDFPPIAKRQQLSDELFTPPATQIAREGSLEKEDSSMASAHEYTQNRGFAPDLGAAADSSREVPDQRGSAEISVADVQAETGTELVAEPSSFANELPVISCSGIQSSEAGSPLEAQLMAALNPVGPSLASSFRASTGVSTGRTPTLPKASLQISEAIGAQASDAKSALEIALGNDLVRTSTKGADNNVAKPSGSFSSFSSKLASPFAAKAEAAAKLQAASAGLKKGGGGGSSLGGGAPFAPVGQPRALGGASQGVVPSLERIVPESSSPETESSQPVAADAALALKNLIAELENGNGDEEEIDLPPRTLTMPLMLHQRRALAWMRKREVSSDTCCGGILADDQGLGKTISTTALLLLQPAPSAELRTKDAMKTRAELAAYHARAKKGTGPSVPKPVPSRPKGGVLIVCPTSVLRQWAREINDKVSPSNPLSVLIHHGPDRTKSPLELIKWDVVLTTYSVLTIDLPREKGAVEVVGLGVQDPSSTSPPLSLSATGVPASGAAGLAASQQPGPLLRVAWWRVVLDEAQTIKNHRTQVAKAATKLITKRRWCLS
eukprot:gene15547-18429_t